MKVKVLKKIVLVILLIFIWPIGLIFLVKSKVKLKKKIFIGIATFLIFFIFWGIQFLIRYGEKVELENHISMENKYIDGIIDNTGKSVSNYNTEVIKKGDKLNNYLISAYTYTVNGENRIGTAVQNKIDGKISQKEFVNEINKENDILTIFSDSAEDLWHSGYLDKGEAYKSSIISGSIYSLIKINQNFIIEGITSKTIEDFDKEAVQATDLMKEVIRT